MAGASRRSALLLWDELEAPMRTPRSFAGVRLTVLGWYAARVILYALVAAAAICLQVTLYLVFGFVYSLFGLSGSVGFWIVVLAIVAEAYLLSHRDASGSSSSSSRSR